MTLICKYNGNKFLLSKLSATVKSQCLAMMIPEAVKSKLFLTETAQGMFSCLGNYRLKYI